MTTTQRQADVVSSNDPTGNPTQQPLDPRRTRHAARIRLALWGLLLLIGGSSGSAWAFFEEQVRYGGSTVSTVHFHLVRAMSRCVGFTQQEAETIAVWSQLVDSGFIDSPLLGPLEQHFSTRGGPNDPFFHWPREIDLSVMRRWASGKGPLFECLNQTCTVRRPIHTGLIPGSHEAFGTYLHSVTDRWSHSECMGEGYRGHSPTVDICELNSHFDEFGPDATPHTYQGIHAMLEELLRWAAQNGTRTRVSSQSLEDVLLRFVRSSGYWQPEVRVRIADDLYNRCELGLQPDFLAD